MLELPPLPGSSDSDLALARSLVGCVLLGADPRQLPVAAEALPREDLRLVWEAAVRVANAGGELGVVSVAHELRRRAPGPDFNAEALVVELASEVPTAGNAAYYAELVQNTADRRHAMLALAEAQRDLGEGKDPNALALGAALSAAAGRGGQNRVRVVPFSDVPEEEIAWLWYPYLPRGELSILGGPPGTGKGNFVAWLAARLSRGDQLERVSGTDEPWIERAAPRTVHLIAQEDHPTKVLRKRLRLNGADLSRVSLVGRTRGYVTMADCSALAQEWQENGPPDLLVVDPVSSMVAAELDTNAQNQIKAALTGPLQTMAQEHGVSILLVCHVAKKAPGSGAHPLTWLHGSVEFSGGVRSAWVALRHQHDREDHKVRLFAAKANLAWEGPTMAYEVVQEPGERGAARVQFHGVTGDTVADVVNKPRKDTGSGVDACVEWLAEELAAGPRSVRELKAAAHSKGFSAYRLRQAREALEVRSGRSPEGDSTWHCVRPPRGGHTHTHV